MGVALAFLHHFAAFALVAALGGQWSALRGAPGAQSLRTLRTLDALYGASALVLLVVGLLRVSYFEKGAAYYFQSAPFLAKLALFAAVGLLSVYPTLRFRAWGKPAAVPQDGELSRVRTLVGWQLAGVALIALFAALMARGIGFFG